MLSNNRAFALVIAMIFALSAAVVGCGDDDSDGTGGSGGSGATGGTGGTGGSGGDGGDGGGVICGGGLTCTKGEFCNQNDECECDPEEDSCAGELACDPIARRCLEIPPEPAEFQQCRNIGEKVDEKQLECVRTGSGRNVWLRMCETSDDCGLGYTVCAGSQGAFHCYTNSCGYEQGEGNFPNGQFFGECDTATGRYSEGGSTEIGACQVVSSGADPAGACMPGGSAGLGETCRQDYYRKDAARLCEAGLACRGFIYRDIACESNAQCAPGQACNTSSGQCEMKACSKDTDCGDGDSLYCNSSGVCELSGTCMDYCNGGSKETDAPFATCSADPNGVCPSADGQKPEYVALYCQSPCDPFEGEDACASIGEGEEAKARVCVPSPTKEEPTRGECSLLVDEPVAVGGDCKGQSNSRAQVCEAGSICITSDGKSTCTALCLCEAGFRAGACLGESEQCSDGDSCLFVSGISDPGNRIGFCGKKD